MPVVVKLNYVKVFLIKLLKINLMLLVIKLLLSTFIPIQNIFKLCWNKNLKKKEVVSLDPREKLDKFISLMI
mgnify:CR=1 FL=1